MMKDPQIFSAKTDILVVGSGIAGLTFAIRTAEALPGMEVTVVTKSRVTESNSMYAQGGVAAVCDLVTDSFEKHIADTIAAGDGLCDPEVVEFVVKEGPARINELVEWGANFDRTAGGGPHLALEGGHSASRVIHAGDFTGKEIEECLAQRARSLRNIRLLEHHFAIDLITQDKSCCGAFVLDRQRNVIMSVLSKVTLLACGGIGQVYAHTTNPQIATGDGIAMAHRAQVEIRNIEFVQFHPTALYDNDGTTPFLISEAVRGAGAHLVNSHGERFMFKYDGRGELAPRDVVSRAIHSEMSNEGSSYVYLDCRHLDAAAFGKQFPTIHAKLAAKRIFIERDLIPVVPSAHYSCGGIATDHSGATSLDCLFACGEVACTGMHGANRLASNSLLEALVFSERASRKAVEIIGRRKLPELLNDRLKIHSTEFSEAWLYRQRRFVQRVMSSVAISSTDESLREALDKLIHVFRVHTVTERARVLTVEEIEFQNILCVAKLILEASIARSNNYGTFFKTGNVIA